MDKHILTDNYLKNILMTEEALKNNYASVRPHTLSSFLLQSDDASAVVWMALYEKLSTQTERFPVFKEMFQYPLFLREMVEFADEMVLYEIHADELPVSDNVEKELKEILQITLSLPLSSYAAKRQASSLISDLKQIPDLTIYPIFAKSVFQSGILRQLKENFSYFAYPETASSHHLRYGDNKRLELEGVVQDILKHQKPTNIILANFQNDMPLLDAILHRYNISYSSLPMRKPSLLHRSFASLVRLGVYKDIKHFLTCLSLHAFPFDVSEDLLAFLNETMTSFDDSLDFTNILENTTFENMQKMYASLTEAYKSLMTNIQDDLTGLLNANTTDEILQASYKILTENKRTKERNSLKTGLAIRQTIQQLHPFIHNNNDLLTAIEPFDQASESIDHIESVQVIVTDLKHIVMPKDVSYVVGCTGENYPGFKGREGLFDEAYVRQIASYPSIQERYTSYTEALSWVKYSGKDVYYSYERMNYEGKGKELAFELDQIEDVQGWEVTSPTASNAIYDKFIDKDALKHSIIQNDTLTTSITAIQTYFKCPFQWYLKYALHLNTPLTSTLQPNTIGNILHETVEQLIKEKDDKRKKQYANVTKHDLQAKIQPSIQAALATHPYKSSQIHIAQDQLEKILTDKLAYLKIHADHSVYEPRLVEHDFETRISEHVKVKGKIDRIDTCQNNFFILDYKTNGKTFSKTKIFQGTQLQLVSYAKVFEKENGQTAAGFMYVGLNEEKESLGGAKVESVSVEGKKKKEKRLAFTELHEDTCKSIRDSKQKFSGAYFDKNQATTFDPSEMFLSSRQLLKCKWDDLKDSIEEIYETFYTNVQEGKIDIDPIVQACSFCPYKGICRFRGLEKKPQNIVDTLEGM